MEDNKENGSAEIVDDALVEESTEEAVEVEEISATDTNESNKSQEDVDASDTSDDKDDEESIGEEDTSEESEKPDDEVDADKAADDTEEKKEAGTVEDEGEPIVFEAEDELPTITEKIDQLSEKYELPEEVASAINTLRQKAESNTIAEFSDYGDKDQIAGVLEFQNNLTSSRMEEDAVRPNTDRFVEEVVKHQPQSTVDYLTYDLLAQPSQKYPGLTRLQEINADSLAVEGDTLGDVMKRQEAWQKAVTSGAQIPVDTIPQWVPTDLHDTFQRLDKVTREDLIEAELDPSLIESDQEVINAKLNELRAIDKGRRADLQKEMDAKQSQRVEAQQLQEQVIDTENKFYTETRHQTASRLEKENGLSKLEAAQRVTLLEDAFENSATGEFAREALKAEGINFDLVKAQSLVQSVRTSAIELTNAQRYKDREGEPINKAALNKAVRRLKASGEAWQKFADDLLGQQNTKQSEQKTLRAKAKIARKKATPKARAAVKTTATSVGKGKSKPQPMSKEWYNQNAESDLAEMDKTRAYR